MFFLLENSKDKSKVPKSSDMKIAVTFLLHAQDRTSTCDFFVFFAFVFVKGALPSRHHQNHLEGFAAI